MFLQFSSPLGVKSGKHNCLYQFGEVLFLFFIWPNIRVWCALVILFWMNNGVLLLLFGVLYVIVVILVLVVTFCALEFACCVVWPRGMKISGDVDLVCEVYMVHVVVVYVDTCGCYTCVDCGNLLV